MVRRASVILALAVLGAVSSCSNAAVPGVAASTQSSAADAVLSAVEYRTAVTKAMGDASSLYVVKASSQTPKNDGSPTTWTSNELDELFQGKITAMDFQLGGGSEFHVLASDGKLYATKVTAQYDTDRDWVLINDRYAADNGGNADNFRNTASLGLHPVLYRFADATKQIEYVGSEMINDRATNHYKASYSLVDLIAGSTGDEQRQWLESQSGGIDTFQLETWLDAHNLPVQATLNFEDSRSTYKNTMTITYDVTDKAVYPPGTTLVEVPG